MNKKDKEVLNLVYDAWDKYLELSTKHGASERLADVLRKHDKKVIRIFQKLENRLIK